MWLMLSRKGKQRTLMRWFYHCGWGPERKQEEEEEEEGDYITPHPRDPRG